MNTKLFTHARLASLASMANSASIASLLGLALLASTVPASAQLYKWVGADGKITYSDTPPPKNAAKVEKKDLNIGNAADAGLPFELGSAVRKHPVVLYTMSKCVPCDALRSALKQRGIPFTEKTVGSYEDQAKLRKLSGGTELPFLQVGREKQKGFDQAAMNAALTNAGYPESNQLPASYQYRAPEPAAPVAAKPAVAEKKAEPTPSPTPEPLAPRPSDEKTPPGFQF